MGLETDAKLVLLRETQKQIEEEREKLLAMAKEKEDNLDRREREMDVREKELNAKEARLKEIEAKLNLAKRRMIGDGQTSQ